MEILHPCFCVILILSACDSIACSNTHEPVRGTCTDSVGRWNECNYSKCRILYGCNSTATFQLHLLVSGDINPNPGPGEHLTNNSCASETKQRHRITYDRSFLLLSNPAWLHLPLQTIEHDLDKLLYRTRRNREGE